MSTYTEAMQQIRKILEMPSKEHALWAGMTFAERSTIIRHAGLDISAKTAWPQIHSQQRRLIIESINRAAEWAARLKKMPFIDHLEKTS